MSENACDRSVFAPNIFRMVAYIYIALMRTRCGAAEFVSNLQQIVLRLFYLTELAIDSPLTIFKFTFFL